jgi:hypothetical protein
MISQVMDRFGAFQSFCFFIFIFIFKSRRALFNHRGKGLTKIDIRATLRLLRTMSEDGIYMGDMEYLDAFGYKSCTNRRVRMTATQHEAQVRTRITEIQLSFYTNL